MGGSESRPRGGPLRERLCHRAQEAHQGAYDLRTRWSN